MAPEDLRFFLSLLLRRKNRILGCEGARVYCTVYWEYGGVEGEGEGKRREGNLEEEQSNILGIVVGDVQELELLPDRLEGMG